MTKKDFFKEITEIVAASDNERKNEILDFINKEIQLMNSRQKKTADKKSVSYVETKAAVIEVLSEKDRPMLISELLQDERLSTFGEKKERMSGQRLTAVVKQLVDRGTVHRMEQKGKAYFYC